METIRPELETYEAWKQRRAAADKAEKEAAKAQRKAERDEIREIRKNQEHWKKRNRELARDLDRIVKYVHGGWSDG